MKTPHQTILNNKWVKTKFTLKFNNLFKTRNYSFKRLDAQHQTINKIRKASYSYLTFHVTKNHCDHENRWSKRKFTSNVENTK